MPYSLVSAATLGFDLVRLPAGRAVAEVLLAGLGSDAAAIDRLAVAHPARGLDRERRGVRAVRSRRAREMAVGVPHLRSAADAAAGGGDRTALLVAQLEQGTIGDVPTLERLLRDDVLGAEHPLHGQLDPGLWDEAADVLADAAVGFWAAGVLPPLVRRDLTAAFDRVLDRGPLVAPNACDLGPATGELTGFLAAVRDLDDAGRARWRIAVDEGRAAQRPWATAMHEASWGAHVSGRTRALAAAQLMAVQAFLDGGFDLHDGAAGMWNAVAGCVQAIALGDLLGSDAVDVLRAPARRVGALS
ncbi:hypothetical protein [Blastococcus xanthinilyticus]|uniref:Uncharacterized protein n=1 Tax=Blastococcus xanthinilyticus TaxID=1564164 RepID=A0A5S5CWR5_9ACTN|nr:hypothetical protein [Blastococcus xanthinilyticus]TYP88143.1 hypothetical protein BD833_105320 [Blastococcus xanthinilyticus]